MVVFNSPAAASLAVGESPAQMLRARCFLPLIPVLSSKVPDLSPLPHHHQIENMLVIFLSKEKGFAATAFFFFYDVV